MIKQFTVILFLLFTFALSAQDYPLTGHFQNIVEKDIYFSGTNTLVRPATGAESALYDSLIFTTIKSDRKTWLGRKIFDEHLVVAQDSNFKIIVDPVVDFRVNRTVGSTLGGNSNGYLNTRGIIISGNLDSKLYFNTSFTENQGVLPPQIAKYYERFGVIPGYGRVKQLSGSNEYDFANAFGSVSLKASENLNFSLGYDKIFIGDGYRSMILSDYSAPMMYFKISAKLGKFEYNNIFTKALNPNFNNVLNQAVPTSANSRYPSKFISFNTLTYSPNEAWQISLVEALVMSEDLPDWKIPLYSVSPFLRTAYIDYNARLTNNLVGTNISWQNPKIGVFYTQILIDKIASIYEPYGSIQAGYKNFDFLNVENLFLQFEYNRASTSSYEHYNNELHYGHFNQALAHPAGNKFNEIIFISAYSYKRIQLVVKLNLLAYFTHSTFSYQDIFNSYPGWDDTPFFTMGEPTPKILNGDAQLIYNLNKSNKLQIFASLSNRIDFVKNTNTKFIQIGLRTAIRSNYYDF